MLRRHRSCKHLHKCTFFFVFARFCFFSTAQRGLELTTRLSARLEEFERRKTELNAQVEFFDLPEIFLDNIDFIRREVDKKTAWRLVAEYETLWNEFCIPPLWKINLERFEELVMNLFARIDVENEMYKQRNWDFLMVNMQRVETLKNSLPLLNYLQNRALNSRHWNEIHDLVHEDFNELSPEFNIALILHTNFMGFIEQIQEISYLATMEQPIDTDLKNIMLTWSTLQFEIEPYKNKYFKIQAVDDCLQVLPPLIYNLTEPNLLHSLFARLVKSTQFFSQKLKRRSLSDRFMMSSTNGI